MQEGKAKMWKLGKITAKTHIGDYGQIVDSFVLLLKDTCCEEVKMTNGTDFILEKNYNDLTGKVNAKGVTEIICCRYYSRFCKGLIKKKNGAAFVKTASFFFFIIFPAFHENVLYLTAVSISPAMSVSLVRFSLQSS